MKSHPLAALALLLSAGALIPPALAQGQNPAQEALYARSLAASCANCHGTAGRVVQGSTVPALAGLDKAYIVAQMNAFKTGSRPATVMHQISQGFSDAQVASLASYFAAQKK